MVAPDAYRSQLYFRRLRLGMGDLAAALNAFGLRQSDADAAVGDLEGSLARDLDSLLLPTIALELAIARRLGLLEGTTPEQRYESFFATGHEWQPWVRSILPRYEFLDHLIGSYVVTTVAAVKEAVERLVRDFGVIRRTFLRSGECALRGVGLAGDADRHGNGRRVLWFRFDRGTTVMYKPTDLGTYRLFEEFVRWLGLDAPHACYLPRVLPRDGYGWMEFVPHLGCRSEGDVRRFFFRSGILLAVAESLNLADGHAGNLVARGCWPVIVDLETLLHNHSAALAGEQPDVLATLIVQRLQGDDQQRWTDAGLMCPPGRQQELFGAVAHDERTDELSVAFGRPSPAPRHLPRLRDEHVPVHAYVDNVVAGYTTGYQIVSERLQSGFGPGAWLLAAARVRPRIIVRPTMYYAYLMRLLEQPEAMISRQGAEAMLRTWLSRTGQYWEWEIHDLLRHDVPYFFQVPDERHLYGWTGDRDENVFPVSAIEYLAAAWRRRSLARRDESVELLQELLPHSCPQ
jgi:lantibiotic modifying enzyme